MKVSRFLLLCAALLSALWMGAAHALPNVDEVQAAVQRGDYRAAEQMTREVLAAKPDSARAHYMLAEILAHERQFKEAADHTSRARALDPAIKFTDPAKFRAFEQLLQRQQAGQAQSSALPAAPAPAPAPTPRAAPAEPRADSGGGVPVWLLVIGAVVFIGLAMRWMTRRASAPAQPAMAGGYGAGGYGPAGYGAGMPQQPTSGGPGLMGMGMAAAGGVAAGMLAERLLHGDHEERSVPRDTGGSLGGIIPGSFGGGDASSAADELVNRPIDFGTGDGWDSGGGSSDSGSSGGDW